jgi:predicted alpha/beta-fold hydrolase
VAGAPLTFPTFRSRAPWWGRDLQTMRSAILSLPTQLPDPPGERIRFPLADGSGDVLLGMLHMPVGRISDGGSDRPLVMLIHGLTGSEDSSYVVASARHFLSLGYPVLRLNLRGAGPSQGHCRYRYHAGRSEDLRLVLGSMDGHLAGRGLFLVGFSLGGNVLLKYLGEAGRRAMVLAAASISAPIDLDAARRCLMRPRNLLYHRYLLARLKGETRSLALSDNDVRILNGVKTIFEFDDRILAPRIGFAGALDYYRHSMALPYLADIAVPTLVIHAQNDPWIPYAAYRNFSWPTSPRLTPLFPAAGGHVGFHGRGSTTPWYNFCLAQFFERSRS